MGLMSQLGGHLRSGGCRKEERVGVKSPRKGRPDGKGALRLSGTPSRPSCVPAPPAYPGGPILGQELSCPECGAQQAQSYRGKKGGGGWGGARRAQGTGGSRSNRPALVSGGEDPRVRRPPPPKGNMSRYTHPSPTSWTRCRRGGRGEVTQSPPTTVQRPPTRLGRSRGCDSGCGGRPAPSPPSCFA